MPSTTLLLKQLKSNYPQFTFKKGNYFLWSPSENTIYYCDKSDNKPILLLHEISHALLGHADYNSDIQLITMEREAWDYAIKLAPIYSPNNPKNKSWTPPKKHIPITKGAKPI